MDALHDGECVEAPRCKKCGELKIRGGRRKRVWYCRACNREHCKRLRTVAPGVTPVTIVGARERLARTLDALPNHDLFARLAVLLERNENFGEVYPERRRATDSKFAT